MILELQNIPQPQICFSVLKPIGIYRSSDGCLCIREKINFI